MYFKPDVACHYERKLQYLYLQRTYFTKLKYKPAGALSWCLPRVVFVNNQYPSVNAHHLTALTAACNNNNKYM